METQREQPSRQVLFTNAPWPQTTRKGSRQLEPPFRRDLACREARRGITGRYRSMPPVEGAGHAPRRFAPHHSAKTAPALPAPARRMDEELQCHFQRKIEENL